MDMPTLPVEVFYSFAEKDAPLLEQLELHLRLLQRRNVITPWHKRKIQAGYDWQVELDAHLDTAFLILLLISPDFLASDYCYEREMQRALQRHAASQAWVIPILLRPVDWHSAPFAHLQALPATGQAITLWNNQDEAWVDVVQGIRKVLGDSPENKHLEPAFRPKQLFPPVWNVPYRYSFFFTGREQEVNQLWRNFTTKHASKTIPLQALSGLGALGKTQTAVEYAYRYRQQYQVVLWMDAGTEEDLLASFMTASKLLERPVADHQNRQSVLASMQEWFRETTDWLVILDNADDLTLVEPFLPQSASGHFLLTTRAAALGGLGQPLALTSLTPDEGALCLLRRATIIPWDGQLSDASLASVKAAHELSKLMGGLPLALEQAGAYIEATGRSTSGYLQLYQQYRFELQKKKQGVAPTYRDPVAFTWNLARNIVQNENPVAIELLYFCAFLAPHGISYDLFTRSAPLLGPTLEPVVTHPLAFDRAIALLRKHSLLKNEVDRETDLSSLIIHPVLQEVLRDSLDPRTRRLWAERTVQAVSHVQSQINDPILQVHLQHAMHLLEDRDHGQPS